MVTLYCELLAKEHDLGGYTIYVFKNLDNALFGYSYIMVTRWPRWEHRNIEIGEQGYLTYKEVVAGVDTWFDGEKLIPYNYTNLVFIKFVRKNKDNLKQITL